MTERQQLKRAEDETSKHQQYSGSPPTQQCVRARGSSTSASEGRYGLGRVEPAIDLLD